MKHFGKVQEGKFLPSYPEILKKDFALHEGKQIEIEVTERQDIRNLKQNAKYWALLQEIFLEFKHQGIDTICNEYNEYFRLNSVYNLHCYLKSMYLFESFEVGQNGKITQQRQVLSTSKLSKKEFAEYLEKVMQFAAEWLNIYLD